MCAHRRLDVWEAQWSCPPSPDLSRTRTGWRTISAAWGLMSLIMGWDTRCTLAPSPATITPSRGHRGGPGRTQITEHTLFFFSWWIKRI